MKITVLADLEKEDPRSADRVVAQVAGALQAGGHETTVLGIHRDIHKLIDGVTNPKPDLVFNLCESFGEALLGAVGVVGLLDLLEVHYVGGGPGEFFVQQDKAITKKLLAFEGIRFPDFAVFSRNTGFETGGDLRMPLFVKPLRHDASIGIDAKAIVHNTADLMKRVARIHEKVKDAALVEEYIDGREFYVGVLGNYQPIALHPIEMDFSGLPEGAPKILDSRAKWNKRSAEYKGTKAVLAQLPEELEARVRKVALDAYRALYVRDYGRVDLRVTDSGEIYVIEVNASCYLEKKSEFATAAEASGLDYTTLINRIVECAVERIGAPVTRAAKA
jgi:D-alanine-D-alanine ligase